MRAKVGSLLALTGAILAALAGTAGEGLRPAGLFVQGGLAPLCAAERALAAGDAASALESFQIVLLRTRREGLAEAFDRVRRRMGAAGRDFQGASRDAGWPLVARSCLLAADFSAASQAAEVWALQTGRFGPRFEYPLLDPVDGKSVWRTTADRVPLWLLRRMPSVGNLKSRSVALANVKSGELPASGRLFLVTPLRLRLQPGYGFELAVRPIRDGGALREVFLSAHGWVQWDRPLSSAEGAWRRAEFLPPRDWVLDRLLVLADAPRVPCEALLVREYRALPEGDGP